ncbi:MAG: hypothetical protein KJP25_08370, partial [Gammaproteobacteria bacterium]|nr:hypothetical protein [Gammaproteobacteria bacterium]
KHWANRFILTHMEEFCEGAIVRTRQTVQRQAPRDLNRAKHLPEKLLLLFERSGLNHHCRLRKGYLRQAVRNSPFLVRTTMNPDKIIATVLGQGMSISRPDRSGTHKSENPAIARFSNWLRLLGSNQRPND